MQVILLENLTNLGVAGDTVSVKNGYARNYLIPRKKCLRATKDNIAYFEQKKAEIDKANNLKKEAAEKDAASINGVEIVLIRQSADDGRLYGSVTGRDVHTAVTEKTQKTIYKNGVKTDDVIKYIGVYGASLELYADVIARCLVIVAPSVDEATSLLSAYKADKKAKESASTESKEDVDSAISDEQPSSEDSSS